MQTEPVGARVVKRRFTGKQTANQYAGRALTQAWLFWCLMFLLESGWQVLLGKQHINPPEAGLGVPCESVQTCNLHCFPCFCFETSIWGRNLAELCAQLHQNLGEEWDIDTLVVKVLPSSLVLFSSTCALGGSCTRHTTTSNLPAGLEVTKSPFTLRVCPGTMTRQRMDIQEAEDWQKEFGRRLVENLGLQGTHPMLLQPCEDRSLCTGL